MNARRWPRRRFLGGAAATVALPLLDAFAPKRAQGDATTAKRLLAIYCGNGILMAQKEDAANFWTPTAVGGDFELSPLLKYFEPIRKKITVLSGIGMSEGKNTPGDHGCGTGAVFTAVRPKPASGADFRAGISFDQVAAQKWSGKTRIASLQLGLTDGGNLGDAAFGSVYLKNISWASPTQPLTPTVEPQSVFELLFAGYDPKASAADNEARLARRRSVLDYVSEERTALFRTLGAGDQRRLEQYFSSVREVEQRLATAQRDGTRSCGAGGAKPGTGLGYAERFTAMADLAVLALQCDMTRVITLHMGCYRNDNHYGFLGVTRNRHSLSHYRGGSHDPAEKGQYIKTCHWLCQQMAYIFNKMDQIPEGTGTLLDNSIGFYTSDCGDSNVHDHNNLPVLLAGSAGGALKTGRHLKFASDTPAAKLYLTMLRALGAETASFGTRGDAPLDLG